MAATKKTIDEAVKAVKEDAVKAASKIKAEAKPAKEAITKAANKAAAKAKTEAKAAAKKASAKKAEVKADLKKENVILQFAGKEIEIDSIVDLAKDDFKANNKGYIRSISVYVKPEDNAAYYVVNNKTTGKVDL